MPLPTPPVTSAAAVVTNIASETRPSVPIPAWGAYGASKAALRLLTAIRAEEGKIDGVRFLSIDPGDMDTPLHALAISDADPMTLRRPEDLLAEVINMMLAALPNHEARLVRGYS